ncbi:MAG: hypothetical protein Q9171_000242 [Xanthocarpia ochracea]
MRPTLSPIWALFASLALCVILAHSKAMDPFKHDDTGANTIEYLQPTALAARGLGQFYHQMLYHALFVWPLQAPRSSWVLRIGAFECRMFSPDNKPIPWDFIAGFARTMAHMTTMGFTNTFTAIFASPEEDRAVGVTMFMQTAEELMKSVVHHTRSIGLRRRSS